MRKDNYIYIKNFKKLFREKKKAYFSLQLISSPYKYSEVLLPMDGKETSI